MYTNYYTSSLQAVSTKTGRVPTMQTNLSRRVQKVKEHRQNLTEISFLSRFRGAEKQGEKLEALLKEKLQLFDN